MSSGNYRDIRREVAEMRQVEREKLTHEEQLVELDRRPGNSTKERARLAKAIHLRDNPPPKKKQADAKAAKPRQEAVTKQSRKSD